MWMERPALLAFQHRHVRHRVATAREHTPYTFQVGQEPLTVFDIVAIGQRDQVGCSEGQAFPPDLAGRPRSCARFVLFFVQ